MRVRLIFVWVIVLVSTGPMPAQGTMERTQKAMQILRKTVSSEIRVTDYGVGKATTFKDARLSTGTKQRIVGSLPDAFFDDFPYEGSTQNAIDKSQLYDLASLPGDYRLYALLFDSGGSNGAIAIVEASAHTSKFLGEAFGWGIMAVPMLPEPYPILVIPQHMSAATTSFGGLLFAKDVYTPAICGVEDESGLSWSLCRS